MAGRAWSRVEPEVSQLFQFSPSRVNRNDGVKAMMGLGLLVRLREIE
jgi:hypothetical protein